MTWIMRDVIEIDQNLTDVNYSAGSVNGRIQYIVIQFTGNDGDTAWANTNYLKTKKRGFSAHYFVDETSIWQCVMDGDVAWHCDFRNLQRQPVCDNTNSLGIAMCSRRHNNGIFYFKDDTVANTVGLTARLMEMYNVPLQNVLRHYDVTGENTFDPFVRDASEWASFQISLKTNTRSESHKLTEAAVRSIAEETAKAAIESYIKEQEVKEASEWAKKYWDAAVLSGIFDDYMPRGYLTREQAAYTYGKLGLMNHSKEKETSGEIEEICEKAVSLGILDRGAANEPLTREQFVVALFKLGLF